MNFTAKGSIAFPGECRNDFPALKPRERTSIVYLDSAATTLKPESVISAVRWFLEQGTAAVHRAVYANAIEATERFESSREKVAHWFGCDTDEVIFTHGATEAINLVRLAWKPLRRVAVSAMEHHSNFVPWMDLERCDVIPVDAAGALDMEQLERSLRNGVDLVALTKMSNVLGTVVDLGPVVELAHRYGASVLVDAAQSASHHPIHVHEEGIDFLVASAHKMLGPSGAGALIARRELQQQMQPVMLGGHMVDQVGRQRWTVQPPPHCFEAGTPAIESVIGWAAALEYLANVGVEAIAEYLHGLTTDLMGRLTRIPGVTICGSVDQTRGPLVAFHVQNLEAPAIAKMLGQRDNVFVRSGFHCAQPLHEHFGWRPTVRASLHLYNTTDDLDRLERTLLSVARLGQI